MADGTDTAAFEPRFWRQNISTAAESIALQSGTAVVFSTRDPTKDGPNEDGALLLERPDGRLVIAIADGMGGLSAGERASSAALESLAETMIDAADRGSELREGILDGFELANQRVGEIPVSAGTTLIAVAIEGGTMRPFHVGDSAALLTGQRGRVKLVTPSHSPVGYAVEAGLLDEEDAIQHEDRHLVSNAIGLGAMKIEVGPVVRFAARDTLVIGSDGLFDNLRLEEIVDIVRAGRLDKAAARLIELCQQRMAATDSEHPGKLDDLTFALFRASPRPSGSEARAAPA